jgi:hypothetical protein
VEWTLKHTTSVARYGADPERGVWAELVYCGVLVSYDSAETDYDVEWPLRGLLRVLAEFDFVAPADVDAAFQWLDRNCQDGTFGTRPNGWPRGPRRAPGPGVRAVLRIVERLRMAGG